LPQDCRLWFYFLYDKFRRVPNQKRHRRRAWEIVRKWFCYVEGCSKGYGTERSLRQHFAQKHKGVLYSKATADQFSSTGQSTSLCLGMAPVRRWGRPPPLFLFPH
jgi:hypothetical protein